MEKTESTYGLLAEFDGTAALMHAAEKMRDSGYRKFDCHSPFPIHGMDDAMGLKKSPLAIIVALFSFVFMCAGIGLQYYGNVTSYPFVISGKPFFSFQAYAPVTFALTVVLAAFTAVIGMLILNNIPKYFHPLFNSDNFKKVTDDGFFISVEAKDPVYETEQTKSLLTSLGGKNIEVIQG